MRHQPQGVVTEQAQPRGTLRWTLEREGLVYSLSFGPQVLQAHSGLEGSGAGPVGPGGCGAPAAQPLGGGDPGACEHCRAPPPGHLPCLSPADLRPYIRDRGGWCPQGQGLSQRTGQILALVPSLPSQAILTCGHRWLCPIWPRTCGRDGRGCQCPRRGAPCRALWSPRGSVSSGLHPPQGQSWRATSGALAARRAVSPSEMPLWGRRRS